MGVRMAAAVQKDIEKLSFEQAMEELEKIVSKLEGGHAKLEDAINDYERGAELKKRCENLLQLAETRVQKIIVGKTGPENLELLDS